ncbi:MAG: hypothetical protein AAGM22_17835 [Acidobacteriota bacterium]
MAAILQQIAVTGLSGLRRAATGPSHPSSSLRRLASTLTAVFAFSALAAASASAQDLIFSDGFESGYTLAWSAVIGAVPVTPYRADDLDLRDPHVFTTVPVFGCYDFTDDDFPLELAPSFNSSIEAAISSDDDGDGFLDLSLFLLFRPLDETATAERVDLVEGACTAPLATTMCGPAEPPTALTYGVNDFGVCVTTVPGTTGDYSPSIDEPSGPCFGTEPQDVTLDLNGVTVTLRDARVGATFVGTGPPNSLMTGLLAGFLPESEADTILLPDELPLIGGQPLSSLLPGGAGNCATRDDRDLYNGEHGWWFYLNFSAIPGPWTESAAG